MSIPTQVIYQKRRPVLVLRTAILRVVAGADRDASCAMELRRVRVGTAPENDLVLTDPGVSRHHLELRVQDEGYLLVDLGSTNGTFYRGACVREAFVGPDAEIRLGETTLRLEAAGERSRAVKGRSTFGRLIGKSQEMQDVFELLEAVAASDTTVLIEGETGTGKELVAEEIHGCSPRRDHPLVVVDCGSLTPSLFESELFGHERGAFSGADDAREGMIEQAHRGTVFLDEIGEVPLQLQSRLLRLLDRRTIRRVGSSVTREVDVRLVAATNRDLTDEVEKGQFRKDLFFRLNVIRLRLPALRERRDDIPLLARHFLWETGWADPESVLGPEVLEVLRERAWPGNVRELRNVVERAVALAQSQGRSAEALLASMGEEGKKRRQGRKLPMRWLARAMPKECLKVPYKKLKEDLIGQLELHYLGRLQKQHGDNISRIARDAGIDRHLVRMLLRKHGLLKGRE